MATIRVQREPFDPGAELAAMTGGRSDIGGVGCFLGTVRATAGGKPIVAMTLEHYPAMTAPALARIAARVHDHPPGRPAGAGRRDRTGPGRGGAPPGGAGCHRLPDRLAQDPRAVLEEGDLRRRHRSLGGSTGGGRGGSRSLDSRPGPIVVRAVSGGAARRLPISD